MLMMMRLIAVSSVLAPRLIAGLEQGLMQAHELLMVRMERLEIGAGRSGHGDLGHHVLRIAQRGRLVDDVADLGRREPATAGEARIFQDGKVQFDLGRGLRLIVGRKRPCVRERESLGIEPPIVSLRDLEQDGLAPGREPHIRNP